MAWVKVESSVSRNAKLLKAGPAPAWLWLCGLAYCQEGLTDGFIPTEALEFLGVQKNVKWMAERLVKFGLWEQVDAGWFVHDYLKHNKSADEVRRVKDERASGGTKGGRPRRSIEGHDDKTLKVNLPENLTSEPYEKPSLSVAVDAAVVGAVVKVLPKKEKSPNRDQWLLELWTAYPSNRRSRSRITSGLFNDQFDKDPRVDEAVWSDMWQGLLSQKAGYEWRVKGMVQSMDNWLEKELWRNRHEAAPVSAVVSDKTARTISSLAEFVKDGTR